MHEVSWKCVHAIADILKICPNYCRYTENMSTLLQISWNMSPLLQISWKYSHAMTGLLEICPHYCSRCSCFRWCNYSFSCAVFAVAARLWIVALDPNSSDNEYTPKTRSKYAWRYFWEHNETFTCMHWRFRSRIKIIKPIVHVVGWDSINRQLSIGDNVPPPQHALSVYCIDFIVRTSINVKLETSRLF